MLFEYTATITTDASGAATVYLGGRIRGRVQMIKYAPGTLDTEADLTITGETSGVPILTKANAGTSTVFYYPRAVGHKVADGAASTLSEVEVWVLEERIKVVVAQGGNILTGAITIWVDEEQ